MTKEITEKKVTLRREGEGVYVAETGDGRQLRFGHNTDGLNPVELLLAAMLGCSTIDVDMMTSRRTEPDHFEVTATGNKVNVNGAGIMEDIELSFDLRFPEGEAGDKARARVSVALKTAHEKTCTVSRTVQHATDVTFTDVNNYDNS